MKGAEPWSPCSLITVLIMLPGNNMHFIFFPSLCFYHSRPHPPSLLSSPIPLHPFCICPVPFVTSSTWSFLSSTHFLCSLSFPLSFRLSVVPDLCGSQGAHEGKTHASHAWELHHAPGPARYTNQSHSQKLQTNIAKNIHSNLITFSNRKKPNFLFLQKSTNP